MFFCSKWTKMDNKNKIKLWGGERCETFFSKWKKNINKLHKTNWMRWWEVWEILNFFWFKMKKILSTNKNLLIYSSLHLLLFLTFYIRHIWEFISSPKGAHTGDHCFACLLFIVCTWSFELYFLSTLVIY